MMLFNVIVCNLSLMFIQNIQSEWHCIA